MNRILGYVLLIAGLLLCGSCQKEPQSGQATPVVPVRLSVVMLETMGTKTVSEADNTDVVYYEVWDEEFENRLFPFEGSADNFAPVDTETKMAEVVIDLVADQTFNLIFWAQNKDCGAYSWTDLKNVSVDYSKFTENNKDVYDTFYAVEKIQADGTDKTVRLYRPFAQLNFGATKMSTTLGELSISSNEVTVSKVATVFNTVDGQAAADSYVDEVKFTAASGGLVQDEREDHKDLAVGDSYFYWVAMNYLFVPSADKATVTVDAVFSTNSGDVTHKIENVPLKKNYRTNIVGDLFTSNAHLIVVVIPDFMKPDLEPEEEQEDAEDSNDENMN